MLTRDSFLNKVLSLVFAALLAISLVPSPAFASAEAGAGAAVSEQGEPAADSGDAQEGHASAEESATGEGSSSEVSDEGEAADDAADDGSGIEPSDPADDAGDVSGSDDAAGDTSEGEYANDASDEDASSLPEAPVDENGEQSEKEQAENSVEEAVAYGLELFSEAAARAVHDPDNPNVPVKVGQYAPGTYTVTANLYIPAAKNPLAAIQAYPANPDNPLSIVEENNGDPSLVTGGVPTTHMEDNATLVVGEDDSLTLTIPLRNPVFTIQKIGNGEGVETVEVSTRAGEYGPMDGNGQIVKVGRESRIDSVTFKLSDSGYTSDGGYGYTLTGCEEYPTILDQTWTVDLDLTVDFSTVPASDEYASDPVVNELTYNGEPQQGVSFDVDKVEKTAGSLTETDAGSYSTTLKPKEGYTWLDGTADERTFEWSIAKATITKKYETVIACGDATTASEVVAKLPTADEVNAGFEWFMDGEKIDPIEGIETRTFEEWNLGNLQYGVSMPDYFPLASLVPTVLSAKLNGSNTGRGCGQKVGHSGVRIGVRMYPLETRELAVEAVAAGFSLTEAAELAGCSRTAVVNWAKAAGVAQHAI